jgi:sporulation protein YlmC with PRC-barrel domain
MAAVAALVATAVVAQQAGTQQQRQRQAQQNQVERQPTLPAGQDEKSHKMIVRASEIIGMDVRNNADENLGSIEDLALDPNSGEVKYAAVSMGGFLGVGDKLFAVPWAALECRPVEGATVEPGEKVDRVAILNVDKESFDSARGFDQDNWPNMADERWQRENDQNYRVSQRERRAETRRPAQPIEEQNQ